MCASGQIELAKGVFGIMDSLRSVAMTAIREEAARAELGGRQFLDFEGLESSGDAPADCLANLDK